MPSLTMMDRLRGVFNVLSSTGSEKQADPIKAHYDLLESHYLNSGVYDRLAQAAIEDVERTDLVALRSLRNPANRVTEFYASKIRVDRFLEHIEFGDAAQPRSDAIVSALTQVDTASNWEQEGRVSVRQYSWAGDLFIKVSNKEVDGTPVSVFRERIDPRHVTDFDKDERGYFTYLRIDVPKTRRLDDGDTESYTQTEVWSKQTGLYEVFERTTETLDEPIERLALSTERANGTDGFTGYDFIPVVHIKFRDVGADRGLSAFGHALGVIREADRIATRLHEMLFPATVWVLQRTGTDADGNPLPALQLEDDGTSAPTTLPDGKYWARGYGRVEENYAPSGTEQMVRLPGGATLEPKIPNRNLDDLAGVLSDQVQEVERQLPETAYYKLRDLELSGVAMRTALMDVVDRYEEAFANLSGGMVRVNQMALTIGQVLELEGFSEAEIGTFEDEGFAHTFEAEDPFPQTRREDNEEQKVQAEAHAEWKAIGGVPYRKFLIDEGYTDEEADALVADAATSNAPANPLADLFGNGLVTETPTQQ